MRPSAPTVYAVWPSCIHGMAERDVFNQKVHPERSAEGLRFASGSGHISHRHSEIPKTWFRHLCF